LYVYGMKKIEVRGLDGDVLCFGEDVLDTQPAGG